MLASELVKLLEEGKAVERPTGVIPAYNEIVWLKIVRWPAGTRSLFNGGFGSGISKAEDLLLNLLMEPEEWSKKKQEE